MTMEKDLAGYPSHIAPHLVLRRMLGEGGTSVVFEAFHTRLKVPVAVKLLSVTGSIAEQARQRLRREAELYALLDDPHLPRVYDVDELADGTPYVVMEFVPGSSLDAMLSRGPLSARRAVNIAKEVLSALVYVHGRGVLHRDVKPANVILNEVDGRCQVRLVDFGIAKVAFDDATEQQLTQQGTLVGTPHYMAPERLLGRDSGEQADIYAVGVMLYEMLAGEVPFGGPTVGEVIASVLRDTPRRLTGWVPHIQSELELVVERAMNRDLQARYKSARQMLEALEEAESSLAGDASSPRIVPPSRAAAPRMAAARPMSSSFPPPSLEVMPEDIEPLFLKRRSALLPLVGALSFAAVLWAAWPSEVRDLRVQSEPQAEHDEAQAPAAVAAPAEQARPPEGQEHALAAPPTGMNAQSAQLPEQPAPLVDAPSPVLDTTPLDVPADALGNEPGEVPVEAQQVQTPTLTQPRAHVAPRRAQRERAAPSSTYQPVRSVPLQPFLDHIDSVLKEPKVEPAPAKKPELLPDNPY